MSEPIGIRLPEDVLKRIDKISKVKMKDRSAMIRELVVIGYLGLSKQMAAESYTEGKITLSEAANQAGITLWEMESYLVEKGFKSSYSIEDLQKELSILG